MDSYSGAKVSVSPLARERSRKPYPVPRGLFLATVLVMALSMINCGNESGQFTPSGGVELSVEPANAAILSGGTQQFRVRVIGTPNHSVTWSVNDVAGGDATVGTISSSGLYTSPAGGPPQVVTIGVTSQEDSSATDTPTLTIVSITAAVTATNNPQVAMYSVTSSQEAAVTIEFGPDTSYGLRTWARNTPSGGGQVDILVAGMRAFTTYHMRAIIELPDGAQLLDSDHNLHHGRIVSRTRAKIDGYPTKRPST